MGICCLGSSKAHGPSVCISVYAFLTITVRVCMSLIAFLKACMCFLTRTTICVRVLCAFFFFLTNLLTGRQDGRVSCLCAQVPMQRVSLGLASSFRLPVNILLFPLSFSHPFYCILSLSQRVDASICSRILRWPKRATCRPIQMTLPSYAAF